MIPIQQLCLIVKKSNTIFQEVLRKCISLSLVLLLLFISAFQSLHAHPHEKHTKHTEKTYSAAVEQCKVCEFYDHVQGKVLRPDFQASLEAPCTLPVVHQSGYFIGSYKFTLQGFTNKGPPATAV